MLICKARAPKIRAPWSVFVRRRMAERVDGRMDPGYWNRIQMQDVPQNGRLAYILIAFRANSYNS